MIDGDHYSISNYLLGDLKMLCRLNASVKCHTFPPPNPWWRVLTFQTNFSGAPNVNFRKISVRKTTRDLEFSEHLV